MVFDNVRQPQASSSQLTFEAVHTPEAKATRVTSPVASSSKVTTGQEDVTQPVKKNRNARRGGKHHKAAREKRKAEKARAEQEQKEKEQYEYDILCMEYVAEFPSLQVSAASPVFKSHQSMSTRRSPFKRHLDALPPQSRASSSFSFSDLYARLPPRRMLRPPFQRSLKLMAPTSLSLLIDDVEAISALNDAHRALWTARPSYASVLHRST